MDPASPEAAALDRRAEHLELAAARLRRLATELRSPLAAVDAHHARQIWQGPAADRARHALDTRLREVAGLAERVDQLAGEVQARGAWLRQRATRVISH